MSTLQSESIKSAITKTLANRYPDIEIYKNQVKQGVETPCFFVAQINAEKHKTSHIHHQFDYLFNVRYHADNPTRTEFDTLGFELLDILEEVDKDGLYIRGKNLRYEITDNVLMFFGNYSIRTVRDKEKNSMQDLILKGELK